ncbi:malic enzyme, NAD binding domain protein [Ostertagia ostertagi]
MANNNARPIIFALSNPTIKAECTAEDAYKYTNGTVLYASGSPFDNVELNGKLYKPGQGNNSYIFPGVALDLPETASLLEVVKMVKPTALLGISTVGGAFTPEIIREMANNNARPIIFALSNPTIKAECTAEDAYKYTNGTVLYASGSPFDNVELNGKLYKPGQGNNSYIFPGVALGAVLFKAKHIPEKAFLIAARRVAASVTDKSLTEYARLYPRLRDIRELSVKIALDIGNYFYENNLADRPCADLQEMFIRQQVYNYEYEPSMNDCYSSAEKDARPWFPSSCASPGLYG